MITRAFRLTAGLLAALWFGVASAVAQSATLTTPTVAYSATGGSVTLTADIIYPVGATPTALGFTIQAPDGWTVGSVGGTNPPAIAPNVGDSGTLGFGYFSFPPTHATFTVTLNYPAGLTGPQTIAASAEYRSPTTPLVVPSIVLAPAVSAVQAIPAKVLTAGAAITSFTPVTAANGAPAYTFAINPALPTGFVFNTSTGAITGTPAAALATRTQTVTITDSTNATASATFSLTVNPALTSTLAIASRTLSVGAAATAFTPVTIAWGTGPFGYTVSPGLPAGLTLDAASGEISGTPSASAAATGHTITITDSVGAVTSKVFTLTVNGPVAANQTLISRTLTAGHPAVTFTPVTGAGGTAPYTYAINPALPANLAFNTTNGSVSGTATAAAASATYTVTVSDNVGGTATNTFTLVVNSAVTATQAIASRSLTAGTAAVAFTPVTAANGTGSYTYSISPGLPSGLTLNANTGEISGTPSGASSATSRTITVTDSVGATASNTFSLTVNAALDSTLAIPSRGLTIHTPVVAFTPVTTTGGTGPLAFSVNPALPTGLALNAGSGAITGTPTVTAAATAHTITITDAAGATTSKAVTITVNAALVATQAIASRTFTSGTPAAAFVPVTGSGGTTPYTYAVAPQLPNGLAMNANTGSVSGTPSGASAATVYTVTITDAAGATATQTFSIDVNGPVTANQAIASKTVTAGTAVVPFVPVTGAGGTAPYVFSIAPSLPTGLAIDAATGAISGTPAAAQASTSYTVTVRDASNATATQSFSLTINAALTANQAIATRVLTAGTPAIAFTPVTRSNGTAPFSFAVSPALPATLVLNATTGEVTGTPGAASAAANYTVTITDSVGATANNTFNLTVNPALVAGVTVANRTLTAGAAATAFTPLALTGGTAPYTWTVAPSLPNGLTLNGATGAITGTPTSALASGNFTITGRDSANAQVTQVLTLVINGALNATQVIASRTLSANTAATAFTPVTGSGGTAPYAFSISPALPPSLVFSPTSGAISGTPDAALSATVFTVTITDTVGATASQTFSLTINGPLTAGQTIATKALTATRAAVAFIPVTGAGGTAPYTYSIAPALPASLVLNATNGSISGTPGAALEATTFTVTVTDSVAATATNTFSLTVNPALATTQAIATKVLTAGAAATAFIPVTASDGTPPYSFAIAPALPPTLTLNAGTGAITGTPNAALSPTVYTVTATDSVGATSSKTFSLSVNTALSAVAGQTIASKALTAGTAAVAFTPLTVAGGTAPYAFSVNPALPTGLVLNGTSGAISGTAAAATASAVYTVTATDSVGATVTHGLTLVVNTAPVATQAVPTAALLVNVAATPFTPVTVAGGTPPYTFTVAPGLPAGLAISATTGAISGTPTATSNPVTHTVTATDSVGATASNTFSLKINRAPAITVQPVANPSYLVGGTLTLSVTATGSPAPTFVWRKGGEAITGNASATTSTLIVPNLQLTDAGLYDVVVANEVSSIPSVQVNVIVYLPPAITTQPLPQTILAGGNATFSVIATGNPTPTYQWRRNGAPLPGATASTLNLTAVPLAGAGDITVVVTNPGGSVTSNIAVLTVNPVAPEFAAGLATTAFAVQNRSFLFPVTINNTTATFSATGLDGPGGTLGINPSNGTISGAPANLGTFPITITATNVTGTDSHTVSLTVQTPPPVITSAASASGRVGTTFSFTVVGTNAPDTYSATNLPPGLGINAASGLISGTPTTAGSYTVGLTVSNATGSISQPLVITIQPPLNAPVYAGTTTPSGTQGSAFTFTPNFGTVTAPYALVGTLPTGLTFTAATGVIAGTPTQVGTFPVTLSATNAGGTTSVPLNIVINPAPAAPVITSASSAAGRVGVAFTFNLTSTGTPAASSYSATGLPSGLTLAPATGAITGTPTAFGTFSVSVNATNTVGTGPTSVLVIAVAPSASAPVITSAPIALGQVGQPFTYTLTGTNSPTSFQITSGVLPAGLSLNLTSGAITGTPQPAALGETRVWFSASSGSGLSAVTGLSLEVVFRIAPAAATPVVTSNGTATAQVGQPFQYLITANSATPVSAYGATGLPAWLTLDTGTGVLSGIPSEATTTPIAIGLTATNTGGTGVVKPLLLTVLPAPATPVITSPLFRSGQVGVAFTYQITASESPTSYVATGLPAGLALDPATGAITGTPTVSNTFEVAIRAANAAGLGAPSTLVVNIAPAAAAPAITSSASVSGQVGVAFSYQIVATNGPIVSYDLTGTLPAGVTLNTSTGKIAGTPAGDPRTYLVQLTATNAGGTSLPQPLAINIQPALGVPVLTTPLFASATVGETFSFQITATNLTGSAPYAAPIALDAVNLPDGLAVNPSMGVIQGTPTAVGTTVVTLTATNAAGTGPARDLVLNVNPALDAPVVTNTGSAAGQVGVAFTYQILAANSPSSYEVLNGPAWLTVNPTTGALSGTPTMPGTFVVLLRAANDAGASAAVPLELRISPAADTPVVISSKTISGRVGTALTFVIEVAPASPAPTFLGTGLPPGLSLNPATGEVSGTPSASGTFQLIVIPSNSNGVGAPVIITIAIEANVTFG